MNFIFTKNGLSIGRDATDKKLYKESTVIYHALKHLNYGNYTRARWVRYNPSKHDGNLTDCAIAIRHTKTGEVYWHGDYAIESACDSWNSGNLFLNKG